jgi:hypothetical protein
LGDLHQPQADAVGAFVRGHHRRFGALDQQGAQVVVAALGDAPQLGLAAGGVLAGLSADLQRPDDAASLAQGQASSPAAACRAQAESGGELLGGSFNGTPCGARCF